MEYRRGLAMRILSVYLANAGFVTKRKKVVTTFLYHMKDHYPSFVTREMDGGGHLYLKFWGKLTALVGNRQLSVDICS